MKKNLEIMQWGNIMKIEIELSCCGDCPFYNWKKHKCSKGAKNEGKAQDSFYSDCPFKQRDKWIPCSERMPEEHNEEADIRAVSELVAVTVIDDETGKTFVCDDLTVDGKWCNFHSGCEVIAWQPLPKPYNPEKGGVE